MHLDISLRLLPLAYCDTISSIFSFSINKKIAKVRSNKDYFVDAAHALLSRLSFTWFLSKRTRHAALSGMVIGINVVDWLSQRYCHVTLAGTIPKPI